jgi:hypothetical protein
MSNKGKNLSFEECLSEVANNLRENNVNNYYTSKYNKKINEEILETNIKKLSNMI